MAKALFGHLGAPDYRLLAEVQRLRRRVGELEAEVLRLRADNDALSAQLDDDRLTAVDVAGAEPALA